MGRGVRRRFGGAFSMVDGLWEESLVESMGFLLTDACRSCTSLNATEAQRDRQFLTFGTPNFHCTVFIKCFINGFRVYHNHAINDGNPLYLLCRSSTSGVEHQCCEIGRLQSGLGSGIAIFVSLIMLCVQIGAVKGGFMDGVAHVVYSFGKRTYGDAGDFPEVYAASLDAGTIGVVITYMNGIFFDFNNYLSVTNSFVSDFLLKIRYIYLIVLFIAMSALLFLRSNSGRRQQDMALIWTTWFSILAPLSWYVIFKAHSYIHIHMSFLLWQMPFTFFGFAVFGAAVLQKTCRASTTP